MAATLVVRGEAAGADATITPMQGRVLSTLMHLFWLNDEKCARAHPHTQSCTHARSDTCAHA
jgi:hypothetical protein